VNYIALSIPVFFLLIGLELLVSRLKGGKFYRFNDSINDLSCGIIQQLFSNFLIKGFFFGTYIAVYEAFHFFQITPSLASWILGYIAVDLCYYWFHRASHRVGFMWAAHVVHHQSEEFNLSVALRQSSFSGIFGTVFYLPLAVIGLPPLMYLVMSPIKTLYQYWIHTRVIGRMGPLEKVLMTPSHHRVHHGRNPLYLDRNHGATFIIWDKLFGTFQEEQEEVHYGTVKPLASWSPIWANFHYWVDLFKAARATPSLKNKILFFLKPPGWRPTEQGGYHPVPEIVEPVKYDARCPPGLGVYIFIQFLFALVTGSMLLFLAAKLGTELSLVAVFIVIWTLTDLGGLFENRIWAYRSESVRLVALPLLALLYLTVGATWLLPALLIINALFLVKLQGARTYLAGVHGMAGSSQLVSP